MILELEHAARFAIDARYVLCVPAFNESIADVERLLRSVDRDALVVLVVNRGPASGAEVRAGNARLLSDLRAGYDTKDERGNMVHLRSHAGFPDVLLVDRNRDDNVVRGGVGAARHIAAAIAVHLIDFNRVASPWVHQTDCDCVLPADLFHEAESRFIEGSSALTLRQLRAFSSDAKLQRIANVYDANAHLAAIGLERAHAPWAWSSTLNGCAIAYSAWAYKKAGGILPLLRSEDAQIMTAVAKLGLVHRTFGEPVLTEARPVSRPSGGFGSAVGRIAQLEDNIPAECAGPGLWRAMNAFYSAIERATLGNVSVHEAIHAAAEEHDSLCVVDQLEHLLRIFAPPIDMLRAHLSPRKLYETVHLQLDMYRASELDFALEELDVPERKVPLSDVWKVHDWAGAAEVESNDWPAIVDAVYAREAQVCSHDTGPHAWSERLFGDAP